MLPPANPYASPKSDSAGSPRKRRSDDGSAKHLCFGWLAVFALNLIVPLLMAWGVTTPESRKGMFLAIAFVLALGLWICASARQIGFPLVVGGFAVALSQVIPILQMMAGILGFTLAEAVGADVETVTAGFVMTMATGGLLVAASIIAGLVIRAVLPSRR